ncbi:MAG: sulfite exporter TauE/SafE family protein [Candidatus Binataceae bacterium]
MLLHYWFLLPVGIAIATLVMSAGVSGATLWVPVYLLWLRLDVPLAFWLGLLTMLFGFGSGVYRNWRDGTYDRALVQYYLAFSIPAAFVAGWFSAFINQRALVAVFGIFLLIYGVIIAARTLRRDQVDVRRDSGSYLAALIGGVLTGLISIGIGVLALPAVLRHRSIERPAEGIGTLVIIIFFTSLAATLGHLRPSFVMQLSHELRNIGAIMLWAAPAVVIGGQIGPRLSRMLPSERHARLYFSVVLLMIGIVTLLRAQGVA